uniref:SIS domain-containing protein n=1 Tax=Amphiprion percula TaxID=161767 RepID=A0A3P8SXN3_AMPPE
MCKMAKSDWTCSLSAICEWESPDYEPSLPVSEKSNPLTRDIDRASANSIVKMLQACDTQMFQEETESTYHVRAFHKHLLTKMDSKSSRNNYLNSGFNRALRQLNQSPVYSYIIAGGDRCVGVEIAPFVAGQLDFCLQHPEVYTPVLVGFNPAHQARDEPLPGCTFTFLSVVQRMQELAKSHQAFLINPAVGPEAISGSSRMKGGSATKILLQVVLSAAHAAAFSHTPVACNLSNLLLYSMCFSLRCGRRVCYLGWGSLALLGLIDASECNPTFGADFEDVRGFVSGGYRELNNKEGPLTALGPEFCIAHEDFLHQVLPRLTDKDTVLLIYTHSDDVGKVVDLARRVREKMANLHAVYHQTDEDTSAALKSIASLSLSLSLSLSQQWELSTKLVLNAVSTGAHVLKGKIYQNHMIDVQVTNSKLRQNENHIFTLLYLSFPHWIYSFKMDAVCMRSSPCPQVVPLALVCLLTGCSLREAESHLERQPVVREAVESCLQLDLTCECTERSLVSLNVR